MAKQSKKPKTYSVDEVRMMTSLKNMYFNRYLMVRYFLALFAFTNFYWLVLTFKTWVMVIPAVLLVLAILPSYEIVKSYSDKKMKAIWTKRYFVAQFWVNVCLIVLVFSPLFKVVFPFALQRMNVQIILALVFIFASIIAYACIHRIHRIDENTDRQYMRIKQFEKAIKV